MTGQSAVHFETNSRIHVALAVQSLERSLAFYRALFGQEPTKVRSGYAKFEVADPPINLAINQVAGEIGRSHPVSHFGIQVKSTSAVQIADARIIQMLRHAWTVRPHR